IADLQPVLFGGSVGRGIVLGQALGGGRRRRRILSPCPRSRARRRGRRGDRLGPCALRVQRKRRRAERDGQYAGDEIGLEGHQAILGIIVVLAPQAARETRRGSRLEIGQ